jgi:thiamine biosynthesis lipoprotein
VRLDPGGIGKGLAADMVAEELRAQGAFGALVDIGGDVRVSGAGPHDGAWVIDVSHPGVDQPLLHLLVRDAGIATSSVLRRRWICGGAVRHHLVDPRDGLPVRGDMVAVTVIAATTAAAEVQTKSIFVAGSRDVAPAQVSVVVSYADGTIDTSPELRELVS